MAEVDLCEYCFHPFGPDPCFCGCPFVGHGLKMAFKRTEADDRAAIPN